MDPAFAPCVNVALAGVLVPEPTDLASDDSNEAECWATNGVATLQVCNLGPATGYIKRMIAVGDSHNNTLIAAYRNIAEALNWRIEVAGHAGCYFTSADQQQHGPADLDACTAWKGAVTTYLNSSGPFDAIIVTNATTNPPLLEVAGESLEQTTVRGLVEAWTSVTDRRTPILAIRDNPVALPGTTECVIQYRLAAGDECSIPRSEALSSYDGQLDASKLVSNTAVIDLTDLYCTPDVCPAVIGNTIVYRDANHLTASYAATLAPYLAERISVALTEASS